MPQLLIGGELRLSWERCWFSPTVVILIEIIKLIRVGENRAVVQFVFLSIGLMSVEFDFGRTRLFIKSLSKWVTPMTVEEFSQMEGASRLGVFTETDLIEEIGKTCIFPQYLEVEENFAEKLNLII